MMGWFGLSGKVVIGKVIVVVFGDDIMLVGNRCLWFSWGDWLL